MIRNFLTVFYSFLFLLHLSGCVFYAYSSEVEVDKNVLLNLRTGMNAKFSDFPVVYRVEVINPGPPKPGISLIPDGLSGNRYTVNGGIVQGFLKGAITSNSNDIAENNVVTINNNSKIFGNLFGVEGVGGARNNTVTLNGTVMFNNAYGISLINNTTKTIVSDNKFTLINGKIAGVNGGNNPAQSVFGIASDFAINASNNLFEIRNSEVIINAKIIGIDIKANSNLTELTGNTFRMIKSSINNKKLLAYNIALSGNGSVNFTSNNVELDGVSKFSDGAVFQIVMSGEAGPTADNDILLNRNTVTISNISEAKSMTIANNITSSQGNNITSTNSNYVSFSGITLYRGGENVSSINDTISLTDGKINTTFNGIIVGNGSVFSNTSTIAASNILLKNISSGDTASANGNITGIDIKSTTINSQFNVTENTMAVYGDASSKSNIVGDIKGISSSHKTSNISNNNLFIGQDASGTAGFITVSQGTTAATASGNVYGVTGSGLENAVISNNNLFVGGSSNGVTIAGSIYGVNAEGISANITGNTLSFGTSVNDTALSANGGGNIYGVNSSASGNITSNALVIAGTSSINGNVYGVNALNNSAAVSENILKIGSTSSKVSINGNIYGTFGSNLSKNIVYLTGSINGFKNLYGSFSNGANSTILGNLVHVAEGSSITGTSNLYGAYSTEKSNMTSNIIVIGSIEKTNGLNDNSSTFNSLTKTYATIVLADQIIGAYAGEGSTLSKNEVVIAADTNVTGNKIAGALSKSNAVLLSANRVAVLNNANIKGSLYGAYAEGASNTTNVSENIVIIGALPNDKGIVTISGHVYGGYSEGTGDVTNNVVQLVGHNDLSSSDVYGGYSAHGKTSGNILYLDKYKGNIKNLYNFDTITFKPSSKTDIYKWTKDTTILNIVGGTATDLSKTKITNTPEFLTQPGVIPQNNEKMNLIKNENGVIVGANTIDKSVIGIIRSGIGTEYKYRLNTTSNSIEMVVSNSANSDGNQNGGSQNGGSQGGGSQNGGNGQDGSQNNQKPGVDNSGPTVSIELEALLGGRDALALMVKRAGDMAAFLNSNIIRPLDNNLDNDADEKKIKYGTFLVSGGGYVKDEGVNTTLEASRGAVLTGFGATFNKPIANIFLSAFFEGGYGTYVRNGDYVDETTNKTVHGKGSSDYYGAGLVLRSDFKIKPEQTVYLDTSFRGGLANYDFNTDNIYGLDISGNVVTASYNSASAYYGTHIGLGYMYNLNDKYIFDVYAKYLFSYYDADKVTIPTGETVSFDDFYSHRINSGLRVTFRTPVALNPYIGAGFEYQADEAVGGSLNDMLRLKGHESTLDVLGAFELGFTYSKKFSKVGLNIDVKGKGTAGSLYSGAGAIDLRIDF